MWFVAVAAGRKRALPGSIAQIFAARVRLLETGPRSLDLRVASLPDFRFATVIVAAPRSLLLLEAGRLRLALRLDARRAFINERHFFVLVAAAVPARASASGMILFWTRLASKRAFFIVVCSKSGKPVVDGEAIRPREVITIFVVLGVGIRAIEGAEHLVQLVARMIEMVAGNRHSFFNSICDK